MKYKLYKYDIVSIYDGEESTAVYHCTSLRKAIKRLKWFSTGNNGMADSYILKYNPRLIVIQNYKKKGW